MSCVHKIHKLDGTIVTKSKPNLEQSFFRDESFFAVKLFGTRS